MGYVLTPAAIGLSCRAVPGRDSRWVFVASGHRSRATGGHTVEDFTSKEGRAFCQSALNLSGMGCVVGSEPVIGAVRWSNGMSACVPQNIGPRRYSGKKVS